ncbi:hypothetical protein JHK82_055404 [Glycine max]|uniref:NB-ARC domain-containing protein n=1 Tax=Glycine max TaxID=3847 RepID=K7N1P1_SOYBN|nr:hypothetical protein JHK86_055241 [Glycine max]KAG4909370.1 hypothetical protein JHK87_055486 [Glycine soja]KAG4917947.1 hypothetical protein JHK85_056228 [Glycine max]KAG5074040.1 hypothetical protein JHK84_055271 [Glycine max]KAG5076709.1 hypothetical protein JHK82_055404 [Glycine max]
MVDSVLRIVLENLNSLIQKEQGRFSVFGREEDKDKIVDFMVCAASHYENLLVYPIVVLGGHGKTTLAQLIYNDERVVNHFEIRIWVCILEGFSLKRMIRAIIRAT